MIVRYILQVISWLALATTVLPSVAFLGGRLELERMQLIMLLATVVWFVVTPCWMGLKKESVSESDEAVAG